MKYSYIDNEAEKEMLRQRLTGLEREHFTQTTNLRLLEDSDDKTEQTAMIIQQTKEAIAAVDRAYKLVEGLLSSYDLDKAVSGNGSKGKVRGN